MFCFAETSCAEIAAGDAAQPSRTPGKNVFDVVPAWTTTSGAERPEARQVLVVEVEVAVGDVLEHDEAVVARELDERLAPLGRHAHAGRVLVVGDRVEQLRPKAGHELPLELVDLQPVVVERHDLDLRREAPERHQRAEVGRAFDHDGVARVEERLAGELERLDRAARDHQLVVGGAAALRRVDPSRERVERTGKPARRRVLERARLFRLGELGEQLRRALARERPRVGESAGEGDQSGHFEQREDLGDPLAHAAAGAGGEELLPSARRGGHGHVRA